MKPQDLNPRVKQKLGEEQFLLLQGRNRITYPKPDKKALTLYFTTKLREMLNE